MTSSHCDVSKGAYVRAAVQACIDAFGPPDIVVNNAGTTHRNQPMLDVDEDTFDRVFNVDVKSTHRSGRSVCRRRITLAPLGNASVAKPN